jgi:hypothetical protein
MRMKLSLRSNNFKAVLQKSVVLAHILTLSPFLCAAEENSCRKEVGKKHAAKYVKQCKEISPATHPPCHDANPCSLIKDEIKRGCQYACETPGAKVPKFCDEYSSQSK